MNKYILGLTLTLNSFSFGCSTNELKFYGNLDYSRSATESLYHNFEVHHKQPIYETRNSKYLIYLGGKVFVDYDVFNNESKINTFSSLGLEF